MSKVLNTIIHPSQTAYVPGRSVADNLRSNFFYKQYCKKNNIDSVLISLDAKKAFDSVSHSYIEQTLTAYGFGNHFIQTFRLLYKDISSKILVNGHMSSSIKIERGVKQGDALSCAIFILCIDPLLRNINENENIIRIQIKHKNTKFLDELKFKASAFADDVSIVCMKTRKSIQAVFSEYEKLTRMSGLELNAEKTEILVMNLNESEELQFKYLGKKFRVQSVNRIKICGLIYGTDLNDEYKSNVVDKITKMEYKMKLWSHRNLSMEGKALIAKTFGISQIIYNMQSYPFDKGEIVSAERALFNFLWSTSKNNRGIDRIKRSILKNDYSEGGLKITDIECLNRSLKLRQFIRAFDSKHEIAKIQSLLSEKGRNRIEYEYSNVSEDEDICKSAQNTINEITDYNRKAYCTEEFEDDPLVVEEISSTDLNTYLSRKKKYFTYAC
jgi:hypothetical protein